MLPSYITPFEVWFRRKPYFLPISLEAIENDKDKDLNADKEDKQEEVILKKERKVTLAKAVAEINKRGPVSAKQRAGQKRKVGRRSGKEEMQVEVDLTGEASEESEDDFLSIEEQLRREQSEEVNRIVVQAPRAKRAKTTILL
ncbi:hypothetical protein B0J14DRAFT_569044 [Halenospora varia]|nr:hypothetical protein B0J14DRAFT_569044 [Halenospora varia]